MRKLFFLGMAANYSRKMRLAQFFSIGRAKDCKELEEFLGKKYGGKAILTKNGRSALALALKAYFKKGEAVLVNGFTCYAVYEAVRAAGLEPIFVDIEKDDLNFSAQTLKKALDTAIKQGKKVTGMIIQNTLGNPVEIESITAFAEQHGLKIVEDLAHCAGIRYKNGEEAGTVGVATVFSFGKDKSIDTISGGALVLRYPCDVEIRAPSKLPKLSDHLRARLYPTWGAICRGLTHVHLGGALMRVLVKVGFVERSADSALDLERKISKFEAKLALKQFMALKKSGEPPLRDFYLVNDREELLKELAQNGFFLSGFWYEKPVSPARYYKKVHFDELACPVATEVAAKIVNLPTFYEKHELKLARKIIKEHLDE